MSKRKTYRGFHELARDEIRDPRDAAEYISDAAEEGDSSVFLLALKDVLDVHGILSALSRKTGLNRANLHQMLRGKESPRLDTLTKVLGSAGLGIAIVALHPKRHRDTQARVTRAGRPSSRTSRARCA